MSYFILLLFLIFLGLVCLAKYQICKTDKMPGPSFWEVLSASVRQDFRDRFMQTLGKFGEKYGKIYAIDFLGYRKIIVSDIDLMRRMMKDPAFTGRPHVSTLSDMYSDGVGHGVVISQPPHWEEIREFTQKQLRTLGFPRHRIEPFAMEELALYLETLKEVARSGRAVSDWRVALTIPVVNSLWRICTGEQLPQDLHSLAKLIPETTGVVNAALTKFGGGLLLFPWLKEVAPIQSGYDMVRAPFLELSKFCKLRINEHRSSRREVPDLIDAYFHKIKETKDPTSPFYVELGEQHLCGVLGDVLLAGADALAASIQWGLLYLALHPEIQLRLARTIEKVTQGSRCSLDMRERLPYVEAVIAEVLRCSSFFELGFGSSPTHDVSLDGMKLYRGEHILYNMAAVHNDPKVWGDPANFRPERHLSEEGQFVHHPNLIPFFSGRRQCLGEVMARDTMFLWLTNILAEFHLELTEDCKRDGVDMEAAEGIFRFPKEFSLILKIRRG